MNECDISVLTGDALRYAFYRARKPEAIGHIDGPLVSLKGKGKFEILVASGEVPEIFYMTPAEQKVEAMEFFQRRGAKFEEVNSTLSVFCTIEGQTALGSDYFDAGMRAYLLYMAKLDLLID